MHSDKRSKIMQQRNWLRIFGNLGLVGLGVLLGLTGRWGDTAQAEVRESPPRAAFQAGGERSETVLKEIAATLVTMDARLERMERCMLQKPGQQPAVIRTQNPFQLPAPPQ